MLVWAVREPQLCKCMTNTAITDPEIMESRFPVQLLSHRIRKGSCGSGTWYGGDGVEREYEFQEKTTFSF